MNAALSRRRRPTVTIGFVGACVLVYLLGFIYQPMLADFCFIPALARAEPYRFLTSAFLHADLSHIFLNSWSLIVLGLALEPILGPARYGLLLLASALGGNVAVLAFASPYHPDWITPVVGASGAAFGLFGALIVFGRHQSRSTFVLLIILLLANLGNTMFARSISWQSHLGGLAVGMILTGLYFLCGRRKALAILAGLALTAALGYAGWHLALPY
ncbi:MAG: rhomboid family intramembrane serine protease [Flaviflexus sp.]|nr:rhomboid family intramembrane serine protease [Flaviflexus sp.]